jgi:(p)ppGpp synthase/HD superfamily hydrolase
MTDQITILRAADTAARWHAAQRRKGATAEPYVNHLIEVAHLVAAAGGEPDAIVAAFLHDAIEDQKIPAAVIAADFSANVAAIVLEVTDDKSLPKETRKAEQVLTAAHKSRPAKLVKLADKIANVRSVTRDPPEGWSVERQRAYVTWSGEVVAGLQGVSPFLEAEFAIAVATFWEASGRPA